MQFAPYFSTVSTDFWNGKTWLIFPDTKECKLAQYEWKGSKYQESTFTTIEVTTNFLFLQYLMCGREKNCFI